MFLNVVNGADVGVVQGRRGARFALEALEGLRVPGQIWGQKFQRHKAAQLGVLGFVHYAHASATEFFDNPILA